MPSVILGNISGGQLLLSGNLWSGQLSRPLGQVTVRLSPTASGNAYVGLSGGMTVTSGAMLASGGMASGMLDGMLLAPGDVYAVPKLAFSLGSSGAISLYALCDAAASGQARVFVEVY